MWEVINWIFNSSFFSLKALCVIDEAETSTKPWYAPLWKNTWKIVFISLLSWVLGIDASRRTCDGCALCHTDFPLPRCSVRHLYHYSCHIIPGCMEWHRPLLATPLYAIRYKVYLWIYTRSPILQRTTFRSYQTSELLKLSLRYEQTNCSCCNNVSTYKEHHRLIMYVEY
jgi:hypothetical protein